MSEFVTTAEAAKRLGVSERRVRSLIQEGKMVANKIGRDYVIAKAGLKDVKVYGKRGRPPKSE